MSEKMTATMLLGLRKMQAKHDRQRVVMGEPNDNTARALERRGLVEFAEVSNGWRYYRVTEKGREYLARALSEGDA